MSKLLCKQLTNCIVVVTCFIIMNVRRNSIAWQCSLNVHRATAGMLKHLEQSSPPLWHQNPLTSAHLYEARQTLASGIPELLKLPTAVVVTMISTIVLPDVSCAILLCATCVLLKLPTSVIVSTIALLDASYNFCPAGYYVQPQRQPLHKHLAKLLEA